MEKPSFQFGLKAAFVVMTGAAILLSLVRYMEIDARILRSIFNARVIQLLKVSSFFFCVVAEAIAITVLIASRCHRRIERRQLPDA
jgi:hypothetical protein